MRLAEPVTALTDYALAVASVCFAISQGRIVGPRNQVSAWFWCAAFIASAVAATAGGTYHGFVTSLEPRTLQSLWNLSVFAMGACGAFVTAGIHSAYIMRKDGTVKWLVYGIVATLAGVAVQQGVMLRSSTFNRDATYHLIQIVGLYCLFRCAKTVRDRPIVTADL